jgi:hypothetical protein
VQLSPIKESSAQPIWVAFKDCREKVHEPTSEVARAFIEELRRYLTVRRRRDGKVGHGPTLLCERVETE